MAYSIGDYEFKVEEFFPQYIFDMITGVRVNSKDVVKEEATARKRRENIAGKDGKLTILAADHPARRITKSEDDPLIMGDRLSYLGRVLRVVTSPEFDGVMGTPDILEDLFIVNYLVKKGGGPSFLDEKVMLGCMNRGGLSGVVFEMDDRFTAFTAESIKELGLDGAKVMLRLDVNSPESGKTIMYCADAVNDCVKAGIAIFIEPLPVEKIPPDPPFDKGGVGGFKTLKNAEDLVKIVGVASALGGTSMNTWLKIPYCENYEIVARASTCPKLMLGGASRGDPTPTIAEFAQGMKAGKSIRGALVGRNVHHPGKDDPRAVALAINGVVHQGFSVDQAVDHLMENRGKGMDDLTRFVRPA
jgi:DhnA family fructose-bisphosphate aldolase class Ia